MQDDLTAPNSARNSRAECLQKWLDRFHWLRSSVVSGLAYCSMRLYGFEDFTYQDVKSGAYSRKDHQDLDLDESTNLDDLVTASRECFENATARRSAVTDKGKTLTTMSSLLLGLVGILLPKSFAFDSIEMRIVCFLAVLALLNTVTLLLVFFDVGKETQVLLNQDDVDLDHQDYKKSLINSYLRCKVDTDNRTDYLVDLYRSARFFFLVAFTTVVVLFSIRFAGSSPDDDTERVIHRLRGEPKLVELLRGPKGDRGALGTRGPKGDQGPSGPRGNAGKDAVVDEARIIEKLLNDPRLSADSGSMPERTEKPCAETVDK